MNDHPRVLHLGFQPIGSPTSAGITLGTMFGDWPQDRLLQVCLRPHPALQTPTNAVIAPLSIAPVDGVVRRLLGRRVPSGALDGMNNSVRRSGHRSLRNQLRTLANAANDVGPIRLPHRIVTQVEAFRPEVLHSLLGGVRAMRLAVQFSMRFDIPIVPHFMDDWPENLFRQGQLGGYARRVTERDFARVLARSPLCLSIGTDMQREFERRYARPCPVVGNSVDVGPGRAPEVPDQGDELTLRYVGGLHLGRNELVGAVATAIQERTGGVRPWRLDLWVPKADASRANALQREFDVVHHQGSLTPEEVPGVLAQSNALLFLESTAPGIRPFTRLSVSTKVPQYLASGRPVLVLGPSDQGSVRALRRVPTSVYADCNPTSSMALDEAFREIESHIACADRADLGWLADEFGTDASRERLRVALFDAAAMGVRG